MDLDTKLKSTKKQIITKIVAMLIAIGSIFLGVFHALPVFNTLEIMGSSAFDDDATVYDTRRFFDIFAGDVLNIMESGCRGINYNETSLKDEWDIDYLFELAENHFEYDGKSIKYYLVNINDEVFTNAESKEYITERLNDDNGFSIIGDDYSGGQLLSIGLAYLDDAITGSLKEAYIMLEPDFTEADRYSTLYAQYSEIKEQDFQKHFIISSLAVILLIMSLILSLIMTGKVENGNRTLAIDKVPNDIRLVFDGLAIASIVIWICFLFGSYYDFMYYNITIRPLAAKFYSSQLFKVVLAGLCSLIYLLLLEFLSSNIRQIKAKQNLIKNTLFYKAFSAIIIKPIKKLRSKGYLKYRPEAFKKQIVIFIIGYALLNVLFVDITVFMVLADIYFFVIPLAFIWAALNIVCLVFVTQYINNLNKIITAFNKGTVPEVNYQKLPQSLKYLYDYQAKSYAQLNRAIQSAIRDERMRSELITNVSHDLKTPLTSIISYVDLLKGCEIDDQQAKEYISVLDDKSIRLKSLIDDLIEASKITSGVININKVNINLSELATQAVVEHQQEFAENSLELIFKGDKSNILCFTDGAKAYRVIENLLSNARKYSAPGSRVYADVYEENGFSIFEIKNISAQALDISPAELIERFVRGDKSRNQEGNGLGLSIADNLCKAMNGKLELIIDGDLFKAKVYLPKN